MDILQAYQADLLGDLVSTERGESVSTEDIKELHRVTDLSLSAPLRRRPLHGSPGNDGETPMAQPVGH